MVVTLRLQVSACQRHALDKPHTCCDFFATRLASHRRGQGKLRSNDRIALGPRGRRRGAQGFGAARASALRQLTSRRLSERSERSERSEFGARPQSASTAEQSALGRPPPSGRLFFGDFLLAKQKKVTALSGAHPDAASRSEQKQRQSTPSPSLHTPATPPSHRKATMQPHAKRRHLPACMDRSCHPTGGG